MVLPVWAANVKLPSLFLWLHDLMPDGQYIYIIYCLFTLPLGCVDGLVLVVFKNCCQRCTILAKISRDINYDNSVFSDRIATASDALTVIPISWQAHSSEIRICFKLTKLKFLQTSLYLHMLMILLCPIYQFA